MLPGGVVIAVLLSLSGDVVTIAELETFASAEACHAYARQQLPAMTATGALGIGCASRGGKPSVVTMKFFGRLPKSMRK